MSKSIYQVLTKDEKISIVGPILIAGILELAGIVFVAISEDNIRFILTSAFCIFSGLALAITGCKRLLHWCNDSSNQARFKEQ